MMTREELKKLRRYVELGAKNMALEAIDAELAKPEVLECRVTYTYAPDGNEHKSIFPNLDSAEKAIELWGKRYPGTEVICLHLRTRAGQWVAYGK